MRLKVNHSEIDNLEERIRQYEEKCFNALEAYGKVSSKDLEGKARKNAKWTDRTTQARRSITGTGERDNDNIIITLEGYATDDGKEYFQYLELYHKKKNAILYPTIEKESDETLKGYASVISKIKL